MRILALAIGVVTILLGAGAVATNAGASPGRNVAIFYYDWYGTPDRDGAWQHWDQGGHAPPVDIASGFFPARGAYSSSDRHVLDAQMREIAAAGVDTVVVSWWGPGSAEDRRLRSVLAAARAAGLEAAIHLEPFPGRTPATAAAAIRALRKLGIRDFYVYDSTTAADEDWKSALADLDGVRVFANTGLVGKALRGGFDGLYTYDVLVYDGTAFGRMCASARRHGLVCAPSVGPGFDASRATRTTRRQSRLAGRRYDSMWRQAVRAKPDLVTITSYNEWHEGTQIEPARTTPGPYESYEGAWGTTGAEAERAYLTRTRYWVTRLRQA